MPQLPLGLDMILQANMRLIQPVNDDNDIFL